MEEIVTIQLVRKIRSSDYGKGYKAYGPDQDLDELWDQLIEAARTSDISTKQTRQNIDHVGTRRHRFPTMDVTDITTLSFAIPAAAFAIVKGAEFIKLLLEIADKALDVRKKYREMKDEHSYYREIDIVVHGHEKQIKIEEEKSQNEVKRILKVADEDI